MSLKCILQGQDSKNLVTKVELNEHIADKNNPHEVTAEQVGALPLTGGTLLGNLHFLNDDSTIYQANNVMDIAFKRMSLRFDDNEMSKSNKLLDSIFLRDTGNGRLYKFATAD